MTNEDNNNDPYRQFLEQKHSKFSVSPEVVAGAVKKATSHEMLGCQRIIAGEVNEVYDAQTESGNVIVRISRNKKDTFTPEKWAIDASRKVGIPVPEVLLIEEVEDQGKPIRVAVENKLAGESLEQLSKNLSSDEIKKIVVDAGRILAKIHSVIPSGFGDILGQGTGEEKTWEAYMLQPLRPQQTKFLLSSASKVGISKEDVDRALIILGDHSDIYQDVTPHLLHDDFGPKHILVSDGKITGILDFENVRSGDPVWDLARWSYFGWHRPPVSFLEEGYKEVSSLPSDYDLRVRLYRLRLGMGMIGYYAFDDNKSGISVAVINLREDLAYFKKGISL